MEEAPPPDFATEIAPLLWAWALAVATLGGHVALAYVRTALRSPPSLLRWVLLGAGASALGSAAWAAMLLGVSSEVVPYEVGYRALGLGVAWAWAVAGSALGVLVLARWPHPRGVVVAGVVFGAIVVAMQWLLVRSLGLQPGLQWNAEALVLAGPLAAAGAVGGAWVALLGAGRRGLRRRSWRWAAALVLGVGVVTGQALVLAAGPLPSQTASAYRHQVPAAAAALAAALGVPLLLLAAQMDLRLRQAAAEGPAEPLRRRKRVRQGRMLK